MIQVTTMIIAACAAALQALSGQHNTPSHDAESAKRQRQRTEVARARAAARKKKAAAAAEGAKANTDSDRAVVDSELTASARAPDRDTQ